MPDFECFLNRSYFHFSTIKGTENCSELRKTLYLDIRCGNLHAVEIQAWGRNGLLDHSRALYLHAFGHGPFLVPLACEEKRLGKS
jgi:hypothetical protein